MPDARRTVKVLSSSILIRTKEVGNKRAGHFLYEKVYFSEEKCLNLQLQKGCCPAIASANSTNGGRIHQEFEGTWRLIASGNQEIHHCHP